MGKLEFGRHPDMGRSSHCPRFGQERISHLGFEYYQGSFNGDFLDELRKLTELRRMAITGGSLSGQIPEWIGELKHLYYLALGSNNMSGEIPESIGQLKKLKRGYLLNIVKLVENYQKL